MIDAAPSSLQRWLLCSALFLVALCVATAAMLALRDLSGIPVYYFYSQDAVLLLAAAAALLLLSRLPARACRPFVLSERVAAAVVALAGAIAYAGTWLVMMRYPQSRDEALAQFAAQYLQRGELGWPIPASLHPVARALMPVRAERWLDSGYWASNYLPVNSGLHALAGTLGDTWLAGPLLLAVGMGALWSSARRIWPDTTEPASVALLLALTSTQLLVTAMTPYAMTAQFALNALWLACFLRGGRTGHTLAIGIGLLASGLHQFHFHVMFVSGFIVWAWLAGRRGVAIAYVAACVGYHLIWHVGFTHVMIAALGPIGDGSVEPAGATSWVGDHLHRLGELEPFSSFARFAAWQNILLLPLAALGVVSFRRGATPPPIALALQLSCLFGLSTLVYQGFGYGYRYLHGLLPCFLLLAAGGWMRLKHVPALRVPRSLMIAAAAFALCFTLPFALWQSHGLLRPYAEAFRIARAAPADVVLVDGRGGGFLQDIVRIDGAIARPLLLDLAYVPIPLLKRMCGDRRVMLFDARQAGAVGIMGSGVGDQKRYGVLAAERRRVIGDLRCDTPVPLSAAERGGR